MKSHESPSGHKTEVESVKRARLEAFRGGMEAQDRENVEFWRAATPSAHAQAMIELSDYAEAMSTQTGLGKDPSEMFPGFQPRDGRARERQASQG